MLYALIGNKNSGKSYILQQIKLRNPMVSELMFSRPIKTILDNLFGYQHEESLNSENVWGGSKKREHLLKTGEKFSAKRSLLVEGLPEKMKKYHGYDQNIEFYLNLKNILSENQFTVREALVFLAEDVLKKQNPNFFIETMDFYLERSSTISNFHQIVSDCRFKSEYDFLKSKNCKFISIKTSQPQEKENDILDLTCEISLLNDKNGFDSILEQIKEICPEVLNVSP